MYITIGCMYLCIPTCIVVTFTEIEILETFTRLHSDLHPPFNMHSP